MRRVVITGMAGFSPIGNDWQTISANLGVAVSTIAAVLDLFA